MPIAPNTYEALEDAVLERLAARFPHLRVERYPDNPEGYHLKHPKGALLTRYAGSRYGAPESLGIIVQERRIDLEITLFLRSLHGKEGIGAVLEAVRRALTGFAPPAFGGLIPRADGFQGEGNGKWRYAMDFSTTTTVVQAGEPETGAPVTKITVKGGQNGDIAIQVPGPD
uniref:Gp37 protein n=1 Tax=Candidatus Kentrum sp. LPFa TaxID=2126335 RepID=A0A450WK89_9GAMM|nr:MAG: Gp37 protein [Candidatus Kentron sp. LPFa]